MVLARQADLSGRLGATVRCTSTAGRSSGRYGQSMYVKVQTYGLLAVANCRFCLQCFDAVGWTAGRASGL